MNVDRAVYLRQEAQALIGECPKHSDSCNVEDPESFAPCKRAFHGYDSVPLSYFDDSECAKKIVTDEVKRQKDAAESEVLECCINSLPSRNAGREVETSDTNLTERCLAYAKQRAERFADKQALAQQGTVMSKEAVLESIEEVIKTFSEERARERRILARAKKRLERNEPLSEEDQLLMATWSGELLQEPPELLHVPATISPPLGVTLLVDTCNRKPQTALNSVLAVAYGAALKPVFPVTEAEHRKKPR